MIDKLSDSGFSIFRDTEFGSIDIHQKLALTGKGIT